MDLQTLDFHLQEALIQLRDSNNTAKGVVASALVDEDKAVYAISEKKYGVWLHAERNAVESYIAKYGQPTKNAIMVVSLSPCVHDSIRRYGASCSKLLLGEDTGTLETPIKRMHIGTIDTFQIGKEHYDALGFDITLTSDSVLETACQKLFDYFSPENYGVTPISDYVTVALQDLKTI